MKRLLLFIGITLLFLDISGQVINISEARSKTIGTVVTISGLITCDTIGNSGVRYLQDNTGGICVFSYVFAAAVKSGDSVTVTGTLKNYSNLLEIDPVSNYTIHSHNHTLPEPILITVNQFSESYEGMLVRINNAVFLAGGTTFSGNKEYYFESDGQTGQLFVHNYNSLNGKIIPNQPVDIIGILSQYGSNYQILVRTYDDLIPLSSIYFTSSISMTNLSQSGFDLHWITNIAGSTELFFGNTPELELGVLSGAGNTTEHNISVEDRYSSELLYVQAFSVAGDDTARSLVALFITQSASSGEMKVYFNRSVDTRVSQGSNAIQLYEAIDDTLISYISRAKYSVDFTIYNYNTFNISDITAALNAAYSRGVEIRIISDMNMEDNAGWDELDPGIGRIISPVENYDLGIGIMHNKFVVFDALSPDPIDPIVWTGSTNFTEGQINEDPNNVIIIQDQSLAKTYRIEFEEMFGSTGLQPDSLKARFGGTKTNNTPHEFIIGGSRVESYFSPSDGTNAKIEETIKTADWGLYVNTMIITRDFLASAIADRADAGVDAKVIVNSETESNIGNVVTILQSLGINFKDYTGTGILHNKVMIVDPFHPDADPLVLTGSHNWSSSADLRNDENSLIIHNADIANIYYQEFVERFRDAKVIGLLPETNNDFVTMDQGDTLTYDVFANDEIPGAVTLVITTPPNHGTASGNNSGIVTYIPDPAFTDDLDTLKYEVCSVANPAFCDSAKMVIYVMRAIGTFEIQKTGFSIYPNPSDGFVYIVSQENIAECALTIYNLSGQKQWTEKLDLVSGSNQVTLAKNLLPGIYILELKTQFNTSRLKLILR
jgi:phosphatidylserine/phosphatidylglycerophosphate/cardiolipin synthase-like enzyme